MQSSNCLFLIILCLALHHEFSAEGGTLVQNCGDSDVGKVVIELAKERNLQTISIIADKPGNPETIEELKALGGDIVVPESYTRTWYFISPLLLLSFLLFFYFYDGCVM